MFCVYHIIYLLNIQKDCIFQPPLHLDWAKSLCSDQQHVASNDTRQLCA